jgi:IS66 Orf2 like protein
MIPLPAGVRVWLATGYTDMRKGFPSLALQIQEILERDPLSGHLFCFRGRRGNLLKVIWHDGQGAGYSKQGLFGAHDPYIFRVWLWLGRRPWRHFVVVERSSVGGKLRIAKAWSCSCSARFYP